MKCECGKEFTINYYDVLNYLKDRANELDMAITALGKINGRDIEALALLKKIEDHENVLKEKQK